ncbi:DUF2690 domain-containing protein [Streptomyces syringium]|uniref:DUF2690 domain-containing protein n=1 Tax=Streptomyces syringium TaxID=76729 RepID=UPI003AAA39CB
MSTNKPPPAPQPAPAPPGRWKRTRGALRRAWHTMWRPKEHAAMTLSVVTVVLGSFLAAFFAGVFTPDPPGEPKALPCPGKGCEGKSPQKTGGCTTDAKTYHPPGNNPASLHMRYSKRCGAVWARVTAGEVGDEVTVSVTGGGAQTAVVETYNDQFTPMTLVGERFKARACAVPTSADPRKGTWKKYCIEATEHMPWR